MKRAVSNVEEVAQLAVKRARTALDDVDSAYVSRGSTTPTSTTIPTALDYEPTEGSIASTSTSQRPKIFQCTFDGCDKAFDRPARLQIHFRSHTNERPFACQAEGCEKTFARNEHLQAHIKTKHTDSRDYICIFQIGEDNDGTPLTCGKSFHNGTRLRRHIAAHEEKEQTKCQECGQLFRKQETLQRHIRAAHLHEDAYRCSYADAGAEECGQTFPTVGQLKSHEAKEHSGVRFFCDQCHTQSDDAMVDQNRLGFVTYNELQHHMKTVHPPTCGLCSHIAASNNGLKAHMEIVHQTLSDRQRFECTYAGCDQKFTRKGNLQVHIQTIHAKVRAYTCGEYDLSSSKNVEGWSGMGCGVSFGHKAALEKHIQTQHMGMTIMDESKADRKRAEKPASKAATTNITGFAYENDRPIVCLETGCQNRFRRDHDLAIHLELHHNWNIDDVNEALAEKAALQGDDFWIGGYDEMLEPLVQNGMQGFALMDPMQLSAASTPYGDAMDLDPDLMA